MNTTLEQETAIRHGCVSLLEHIFRGNRGDSDTPATKTMTLHEREQWTIVHLPITYKLLGAHETIKSEIGTME